MTIIQRLNEQEATDRIASLIDLLRDAVDSGASISFMPPLLVGEAWDYWEKVIADVSTGCCLLLVVTVDGALAGSVQVALESRPNGAHRAGVQKLMVHRHFRQRGLGKALMQAAEDAVRQAGRSLIVLDTRQGDAAEMLYRKLGYTEAGIIPGYALDADGVPHSTVIFYKQLTTEHTD